MPIRRMVGEMLRGGERAFQRHHVTMRQEHMIARGPHRIFSDTVSAPSACAIDGRGVGPESFAEPSGLYRARRASRVVRRKPKRMKARKPSIGAQFLAWVFRIVGSFQPYGRPRVIHTAMARQSDPIFAALNRLKRQP